MTNKDMERNRDVIPKVQSPWRRYFARSLDIAFYSAVWSGFLALVFRVNLCNRSAGGNLLDVCVTLLLMLLLEPLLLSVFGTTLGKWVLGLRVTDNEGSRLKYTEALSRTWKVFEYGMGFNIPIYYLYRSWKSYEACVTGVTLEWEYDSNLILRDERIWRTCVYLGVRGVFVGGLVMVSMLAQIPGHRGELTVQQFCENYRSLEAYYGLDATYGGKLNDMGQWVEDREDGTVMVYITENTYPNRLDFTFDVDEKGKIVAVHFGLQAVDSEKAIPSYQQQMQLAALAYVGAQENFRQLSGDRKDMVEVISKHNFEDFAFSMAGVEVVCEVECQGYKEPMPMGYLWPVEGEKQEYLMQFSMEKE